MCYIHETESINLPEVLYSAIEEVLTSVEDDTEPLVDPNTLKRNDEEIKKNDFLFKDNTIKYDSKINVNWNVDKNEYYHGEIYNVARLLSFSDSLSKLNDLENEKEFDEILEVTNDTFVVRSLLGEIFENSFKRLCDDESTNDIIRSVFGSEHADFGAFNRLDMNYREGDELTCRAEEIDARWKEFDVICELNARESELNKLNEDGEFENAINELTTITDGKDSSKLTSLLTKLHDSEIFNSVEHVSKEVNPGENRKYTSFENIINEFFKSSKESGNDMLKELTPAEIFALNNRTENDKWVENIENKDVGEIVKFNNAINSAIKSDIYTTVVKSDDGKDKLEVIKSLYDPKGKQDHLEDFSTNLSNSYLLELQLPHIYDDYIYKSLKDSAPNGENTDILDYKYFLLEKPYEVYHGKHIVDWSIEGKTIDSLLVELNTNKLDFKNVGNIGSDQIDSLLTSLGESSVLAYNSLTQRLSDNDDERSFYEYIICSIDSNIKAKIYGDNIFGIEDAENQRKFITTKDIKNFKSDNEEEFDEKDFVVNFMYSYDKLKGKKPYDEANDIRKEFIDENNNFVDINTLSQSEIDGLIDILHKIFDSLYQSDTFNFRDLNSEEYHIKGGSYLNRTTYEHGIICLSNEIRDAICSNLNLKELDGYRINTKSSNYLNTNKQFKYEQNKLIGVLNEYKKVVKPMESINIDPVTTINNHRDAIWSLFESISHSLILNDTNDGNKENSIIELYKGVNPCDAKEQNYLSLYDDIVIYVLNETNETIYKSLKFDLSKNTMNISNMKTKMFMKNQDTFQDELYYIIGEGGVTYYANQLGINKDSDVTFDIDFISNEENKVNVMELLKLLESSYCFNFTKSGEGYHGRGSNSLLDYENNVSTFERIALSIFNQSSFAGRIYDESNVPQNERLVELTGTKDTSKFNDELVVVSKIMEINKTSNEGYISGVTFFDKENAGEFDKLFDLFNDVKGNKNLSFEKLEVGKPILNNIGKIYILHDIEPKQIRELSTSQSIENNVSGGMNNINDACIVNKPSYYYYEDRTTCNTFNACAESYVAEIDTIINILDIAKKSNVSGNINTFGEDSKIFEPLLLEINKSNIFRPISSDIVVKIFSQIQIVSNGKTLGCDYFINEVNGALSDKTNIVTNNFESLANSYDDIYYSEGEAFDRFLNYAIKRIKGVPTFDIVSGQINMLVGDQMIKNFDNTFKNFNF